MLLYWVLFKSFFSRFWFPHPLFSLGPWPLALGTRPRWRSPLSPRGWQSLFTLVSPLLLMKWVSFEGGAEPRSCCSVWSIAVWRQEIRQSVLTDCPLLSLSQQNPWLTTAVAFPLLPPGIFLSVLSFGICFWDYWWLNYNKITKPLTILAKAMASLYTLDYKYFCFLKSILSEFLIFKAKLPLWRKPSYIVL